MPNQYGSSCGFHDVSLLRKKTTILALVAPVLGGVVCHLRDHDLLQLTHALHHRAPAPGKKNQLFKHRTRIFLVHFTILIWHENMALSTQEDLL